MIRIAVAGTRGFPNVQGGVENHCENLYPHLASLGCSITVFTRKPYVSQVNIYKDVAFKPLSCPQNKFLEAIVHTFKSVIMARKLKPDLLHLHAIGPSLFAPLARILGMKVVVTHHGPDYKRKKWSPPAKIFLRFCERMGMTFANEIISIAANIADDIKLQYGKDSTVIPNGVDIPLSENKKEALKNFGLQKHKYILTVGRFVPEKGYDDLIEAFTAIELHDWKLVIVGGADHKDKYSRELKTKSAMNIDIVLTGFLSGQPLEELYSHAGLFVIPSYYEGLPIVLLEAMSYGLSCLASDIPANRNVELSEERYFRTGDINSLSEKITELVNKSWDDQDRQKQVEMVSEKYNWKNIADETMKVYERVVSTGIVSQTV